MLLSFILTGEILGIVIGSLSGVLVLVAVVVVVVIYRKHQRRKAWNFEYYDLDDESTSKSAPISRYKVYQLFYLVLISI